MKIQTITPRNTTNDNNYARKNNDAIVQQAANTHPQYTAPPTINASPAPVVERPVPVMPPIIADRIIKKKLSTTTIITFFALLVLLIGVVSYYTLSDDSSVGSGGAKYFKCYSDTYNASFDSYSEAADFIIVSRSGVCDSYDAKVS